MVLHRTTIRFHYEKTHDMARWPPGREEVSLGESPARMAVLAGFGVVLGLIGGVAAYLVVRLVGLISNLALLHRVGFTLPNLRDYHPTPVLIPVAIAGAVVVVLLALWSPVIKGHGIPESLEAILLRESRVKPRVVLAKPLSAAVAIGTGGPFGAEGPIIVTGGCSGSLIGQMLRISPAERRILLATGAAAGMAGVFATPIAAILIAFELLLFERSLRALLPLVLATGIATEIHTLLLGSQPVFAVTHPSSASAEQLPLFAVLGVAAGLLAVIFNKGLFAAEAGFRRLPIPELLHPLLGALAFAFIGLAVPGSLSVGYWAITDSVNGRFLIGTLALLFFAKMFSWWIALASNTSGGTLAPVLLIGATMGEMIGIVFSHLFPSAHVQPGAFALVAMGATFGVASRAALTGAVFALEATGDYRMIVPMLLVLGIAEITAEQFLSDRLMTDRLVRRGFRVEFDTETDPFRTAVARQAMAPIPDGGIDPDAPSLDGLSYVRDALAVFLATDTNQVVVTDDGVAVGVLTRDAMSEVLAKRLAESTPQDPSLCRHRPAQHPHRSTILTAVTSPSIQTTPAQEVT